MVAPKLLKGYSLQLMCFFTNVGGNKQLKIEDTQTVSITL